jgi:hypothetical protein
MLPAKDYEILTECRSIFISCREAAVTGVKYRRNQNAGQFVRMESEVGDFGSRLQPQRQEILDSAAFHSKDSLGIIGLDTCPAVSHRRARGTNGGGRCQGTHDLPHLLLRAVLLSKGCKYTMGERRLVSTGSTQDSTTRLPWKRNVGWLENFYNRQNKRCKETS